LRVSRSICTVGLYCLLLGACADTAGDGPATYVVRPEDTLYSIAWRHDLDYRDLARWNDIGADFRISVGQVLVLGPRGVSSPARESPRAVPKPAPPSAMLPPQVGKLRPLPESSASASPSASARSPPASASPSARSPPTGASAPSPPAAPSQEVPSAATGALRWVWPTDRVGAPRPVPGGGILLSGRLGQDVRAANAGRVVYTGSGLRGYGNLVIIKHADSLLSAYAHNREMLVHEGQEVAMGQVIAHMGEGPHQSPVLYFEIRQNGRPVDPLPFFSNMK
jgi:lipoprotein NlpD